MSKELLRSIQLFLQGVQGTGKDSKCLREVNDLVKRLEVERKVLDEKSYEQGSRMARLGMLRQCCRDLGYEDPKAHKANWIVEREETVHALRDLCRSYGDNDWDNNLHLVDVVEKHLSKHLHEVDMLHR